MFVDTLLPAPPPETAAGTDSRLSLENVPSPRPARPAPTPVSDGRYVAWKPAAEFVFAFALLVLSSPVILLTAVLVKLTSRGPAFYSQFRLGKNGRPFLMFKLRTMYRDAECASGACWSIKGDPRVTPLGRFLRKTHLDELPQLWNVLRGDMSLVGPRPERPEFVPTLEKAVPGYRDRLLVKPGVTGLAQVRLEADTDLEKRAPQAGLRPPLRPPGRTVAGRARRRLHRVSHGGRAVCRAGPPVRAAVVARLARRASEGAAPSLAGASG